MALSDILLTILDRLMYMVFILSCLFILRQSYLFIKHLSKPEPIPFKIDRLSLLYLGISISITLSAIFKGIGL